MAELLEASLPVVDGLDMQKIRYIDVEGVRTRYYEDGVGEPLVLIHGGSYGSYYSLDAWSLNFGPLAARFHVYALDKLGHGYTDNPRSDVDYTFDATQEHVYGFMRALGISQAHLAGHSRGGMVVACLALDHPELVKSAVIVDSSTAAPEDARFPSQVFYADIARRTPPGPPTRETVRMEADGQAHWPGQVTDDFVERMYQVALQPKHQEVRERMKALAETVWFPNLNRWREATLAKIDERGLPVPTLVIWGFNDRSAPLPLGLHLFERICARTRQAELHVLKGAGHYTFRDQYQAFNRTLASFCLG